MARRLKPKAPSVRRLNEIRLEQAARNAARLTDDYRKACDDCGRKILKLEAELKVACAKLRALDDIIRERTEERDHLADRAKDLHASLVEVRKADQAEIDVLKKRLEAHGRCPDEFSEALRENTRLQVAAQVSALEARDARRRLDVVVDEVIAGLVRKVTS